MSRTSLAGLVLSRAKQWHRIRAYSKLSEHQEKLMREKLPTKGRVQGVRHVVAVGSGKGGVGKSTISVSLATSLAMNTGKPVGLLDADVYGPSLSRMLGVFGERAATKDGKILPRVACDGNLFCLSMGILADSQKQPFAWRGPMVMSAIRTLLLRSLWPDLDYLIIDLPPGTGDVHLSILQEIQVSAMIGVTTPQKVALDELVRCMTLFRLAKVPLLGLVENMATFRCDSCGHVSPLSGQNNTTEDAAKQLNLPLLGSLCWQSSLMKKLDDGNPEQINSSEVQALKGAVDAIMKLDCKTS